MQVHEKSGNMDNTTTKVDSYWARRMPRTVARGAVFYKSEEKVPVKPQEVIPVKTAGLEVKKKRIAVNEPKSRSIKEQILQEQLEERNQRLDRQASELTKLLGSSRKRSIAEITLAVSYVSELPVQVILGLNRKVAYVNARAAVCVLARLMGNSFPKIGEHIGRDHGSVMHLCKVASLRFEVDLLAKNAAKVLGLKVFQ